MCCSIINAFITIQIYKDIKQPAKTIWNFPTQTKTFPVTYDSWQIIYHLCIFSHDMTMFIFGKHNDDNYRELLLRFFDIRMKITVRKVKQK